MLHPDEKTYSKEAILALVTAIKGDEDAFNYLVKSSNLELAALADYLVYNKESAFDWLKKKHFTIIVSFIGALDEDEEAMNFLMTHHGKPWAAAAELVNGNDTAEDFLEKFYPHFYELADALISKSQSGSGSSGSVGGGYSGGGGGGFGGGSFGGGGGGGNW